MNKRNQIAKELIQLAEKLDLPLCVDPGLGDQSLKDFGFDSIDHATFLVGVEKFYQIHLLNKVHIRDLTFNGLIAAIASERP